MLIYIILHINIYYSVVYVVSYYLSIGCAGSSLLCTGFSLVAASRGHSSLWCLSWLWLLVVEHGLWGTQTSVLWHSGFVAPQHMGSSWPRAQTHVPSLAGKFSTTGPPGKSLYYYINHNSVLIHLESGRHDFSLYTECSAPGSHVSCPTPPSFQVWHLQGKG